MLYKDVPVIALLLAPTLVLAACAGGQSGVLSPPTGAPDAAILTGGQPSNAEIADVVRTGRGLVISLRLASEPGQGGEEAAVLAAGGTFVRLPVGGAVGLTQENASRLNELVSDPSATVVHCGSGNRAGALLALRAFLFEDADREAALAIGEAAGLASLRPAVVERLDEWCAAGLGSCAP